MTKFLIGVAGVVVVVALFWMWPGLTGGKGPPEGPATSVRTSTVARRDLHSTILATGVVRPMVGAEVRVGSRVSGVLQALRASIGDRVEADDVLARLDPTEFRARVAQAEAALAAAEVEERFAGRDLARARELATREIIPQSELDSVERRHQVAAASLARARADLRFAEIQLDYTVIRAPVSGVVASVSTQVGETVAASFASPTFVTIIDLDRLEIWAYVDETDIGRVEAGQEARFTVDTYPGTEFSGLVTAIQPKAEIVDNVVNYVTIIQIGPTSERTLRPEMTTTVNILEEGREAVLALPNGAVRRDSEGVFAYVRGANGPERRAIVTGYRGGDYTEVLEGLDEGDEVLVGAVPGGA